MNNPEKKTMSSNRSFGVLFFCVFGALFVYGRNSGWFPFVNWTLALLSGLTLIVALCFPAILSPFHRAWFLLGEMLGKIVSPVVLGVIFFGLLTPVGLVTRLFGRDELRLKKRESSSHWVEREPAGPPPESFNNQF